MDQIYQILESLLELAITLYGFYIVVYYATGRRLTYSPGQVLGLSIRGLFKGLWWLLVALFELVTHMLGALIDSNFSLSRPGRNRPAGQATVDGAHFLKGLARWRLIRRFNDGLVIDGVRRIGREQSFRHLALVAPTGTGKTTSYVIPNLLRLSPTSSAVVTDPSGELFKQTSGYLAKKGFDIKVLNVSDPANSLSYNPMARARTPTQIEELCEVLIGAAYGSARGDQQFWNTGAMSILSVLIRCLFEKPERFQNEILSSVVDEEFCGRTLIALV